MSALAMTKKRVQLKAIDHGCSYSLQVPLVELDESVYVRIGVVP